MRPVVSGGVIGSVLLLALGPTAMKVPAAGPLAPYIQTSDNGAYVDWLEGHVGVRGTATISRKIAQNRVFYLQTKTAAEIQGHERMLSLIDGIARDGRTLLSADAQVRTKIGERVKNQQAEEIVRDKGPVFEVVVKTPLWGPDSLMQVVLGEPGPPRIPPGVTTAGVPAIPAQIGEGPTGLIVDARGLESPAAALLPRILDEAGRLVHGVDSADPSSIRERGLVAYAVSPYGVDPLSAGFRQGDRPMMVKAVSSTGSTHADLIIRQADADRVAALGEAPAFLKECRVIVLMNPPPPQKPHTAPGLRTAPRRVGPRPEDPNLH